MTATTMVKPIQKASPTQKIHKLLTGNVPDDVLHEVVGIVQGLRQELSETAVTLEAVRKGRDLLFQRLEGGES